MIKIPRKVNNGIIELCDATPSKKGKIIVSKNNIAKSQQFVPIDLKEENLGGLPSTSIQGYDIGSNRVITNSTTILNELGKELLIASRKGDIDGIKHLLTKGAPFSADWLGTSPLHLAAQNNHVAVCEILLRAGISIDARTKVDRTPLHMAAYEGYLDIVNLLIENQADINCKDLLGMTPLHWAVQNGHYEVMEFLITNGADINVPNKFTLTPADIAAQINRNDMIEFINSYTNDSTIAAQNLVLELQGENCEDNDPLEVENTEDDPEVLPSVEPIFISTSSYGSNAENTINLEEEQATLFAPSITISSSDSECVEEDSLSQQIPTSEGNGVCDSAVKLLQEHGITMIQADSEETNILNAVMESGHSVVLTDIGKEVLNSVKQSEEEAQVQTKRIITVTPEEFLAMTNNISKKQSNNSNKIRILPTKQGIKRIIMKKNRGVPFTNNISNVLSNKQEPVRSQKTEVEQIMSQLIEAKKTIEEYKIKLKQKEQEAERYKMQLKLLLDS